MIPTNVIIHCSASQGGYPKDVDDWHAKAGFRRSNANPGEYKHIGYQYLILNGRSPGGRLKCIDDNGLRVPCRKETEIGAHTLNGYNSKSVGICVMGRGTLDFTAKQLRSLHLLVLELRYRYAIPIENILGHYEAHPSSLKTCPEMDMDVFRKQNESAFEELKRIGF